MTVKLRGWLQFSHYSHPFITPAHHRRQNQGLVHDGGAQDGRRKDDMAPEGTHTFVYEVGRADPLLSLEGGSNRSIPDTTHGTAIYAAPLTPLAPPQLIGIYGSPMECLGSEICYFVRYLNAVRFLLVAFQKPCFAERHLFVSLED